MTYFPLHPRTPYEKWRWAEQLFEARDHLKAAEVLEDLLQDPEVPVGDLPQVRELLARAYFHSARLDRAADAAREALRHEPGNTYLVLLLGRSLERAGRQAEAEPHLRMAAAAGLI
ncbi:tetratricopeptide repeat protein [Nocardioides sp. Y6]|uniref:Tetratricopeptide repeat protein n=1 Tax=Nocardioides malaquae TaxID=2773426 RepID=A0ABR9RP06_9ACTN|nr:tetratricopeptide repeat protein [Nocardioides malaquae]MBE7323299.1 tetratricopeptide repeat protein [Nocardioides malaquae]